MSEEWKDSVEHIAIDGSRKGVSVRDADCGWPVVQLDYDGEDEPWYVVFVTMLAELDVQRTIKRADVGLRHGFVVSDWTSDHSHKYHGHHRVACDEERTVVVDQSKKMQTCGLIFGNCSNNVRRKIGT